MSKRPLETPVIRILADCHAGEAEAGARGSGEGRATVCVNNRQRPDREVIVAVGLYSGENIALSLQFFSGPEAAHPQFAPGWRARCVSG